MNSKRYVLIALTAVLGLAARPAQVPQLSTVMQQKLAHSQKILEAVVTSDWTELETETRELERLTTKPGWAVLNYPEYVRYSAAFVEAVQRLHQAAAQRDLDETPKAYVEVTLQCVNCHRYLARMRVAETN